MKGSAHDSFRLLYDRLTSELFIKNDEMRNPLVYTPHSDFPITVQKSNYNVTKNNANI